MEDNLIQYLERTDQLDLYLANSSLLDDGENQLLHDYAMNVRESIGIERWSR